MIGRRTIGLKGLIAALSALVFSAAAAGAAEPLMIEGPAQQVAAHSYMVPGYPNVGIVVGTRGVLVIDTGLGPANGARALSEARRLASAGQKLYLTTTHIHPEHFSGQSAFPADTVVIRPRTQKTELEREGRFWLDNFTRRSPRHEALLRSAGLPDTTLTFDRRYTLDLGGVVVDLLYFGAAHTLGDAVVFVRTDKVLYSGDVIQNRVVPNPACAECNAQSWLKVAGRIARLRPQLIVPDHSAPGGRELIDAERGFLAMTAKSVEALAKQCLLPAEAKQRLTDQISAAYPGWTGLANVATFLEREQKRSPRCGP